MTRRGALAGLGSLIAAPLLAEAPSRSLRPVARAGGVPPEAAGPDYLAAIEEANLGGSVGVAMADMDEPSAHLVGIGGARLLPPASVTKTLTAVYALGSLGPDHRFLTRLLATGPIVDGMLEGDLILAGGGDPHLVTDDLAEMAMRLRANGLRGITGKFLIWEGALPLVRQIDPEQLEHLGYSPSVSGLNLNFNRVHFEWRQAAGGYAVTMDARSETRRPDVTMSRMRIEERDTPVYTYRDAGGIDDWTVAKSALGEGGARWLPVRYPGLYAADVFRTVAAGAGAGVRLPAGEVMDAPPDGTPLVVYPSAPLAEIVADMLEFSTNLTAEAVGMAATAQNQGLVKDLGFSSAAMARWLVGRYGIAARLVDHSGLSDRSHMTANGLARFLAHPDVAHILRPLLKEIPVLDGEGRPIPNHAVKVVAKTGTLNFVSSLAGYLTTAQGGNRAFAIFAADEARREASKTTQDEIPTGARSWNARSRRLQQKFLVEWGRD